MDTVLTVLAVAAVLILLAAAWWFVRSRGTPSASSPPPLLGAGWQLYSRPTELEPPGTIFRIDGSKRRYIADTLTVPTQRGDEAVGRREESVQAKMGMVARFFGLGPRVDIDAEHTETFVFELGGSSREYVDDSNLDTVLDPWLEQHELREGSRYFVIREAIRGGELTYRLDRGQIDKLGGEASLADAAKLEGNLHTSTSKSSFLIKQVFKKPMRVMFLPEELRPLTRGVDEETVIGRRPVTKPLIWGFDYTIEPVDEFEDVVGVFYGGRGQVGQQFVVTNRRLLMGPIDTGIAQQIDAYILKQAVPRGGDLINNILGNYAPMSPKMLWLRHIVDVRPTNNARLFNAPSLRLKTDTDQVFDLGVVVSPTTWNLSPKNNAARDAMVEVLRKAVQAAKAAPPPAA